MCSAVTRFCSSDSPSSGSQNVQWVPRPCERARGNRRVMLCSAHLSPSAHPPACRHGHPAALSVSALSTGHRQCRARSRHERHRQTRAHTVGPTARQAARPGWIQLRPGPPRCAGRPVRADRRWTATCFSAGRHADGHRGGGVPRRARVLADAADAAATPRSAHDPQPDRRADSLQQLTCATPTQERLARRLAPCPGTPWFGMCSPPQCLT